MTSQNKKKEEELIKLFDKAPIKKTFGMTFHYDQGSAIFELPYNPGLDHALGGTHGGVIATLLDNAGWFTVALYYDTWIATSEFQTRLLEPVTKETLISRGWIIRQGKTLSVAGMEVKTSSGKLIATGTGSFVVTSVPYNIFQS
ncbi:MAG TPA: hypothetical protein DDW49_06220 [Deltaproteobacteria bacterium]|nr:MAG: hypothetical protein A2048_03065 [Deltaproteobacteria bacterium GWA2_45_12]HBF12969.1 hypothetical protein [Deltaproteobacteria bacterium]